MTMPRKTLCVVAAALLAGCASHDPRPPAGHGEFASAREPQINANTHFAAGQLDETQRHFAEAIEQYKQALALNGRHLSAMYRLGVVYAEVEQYPQALEIWKRYVTATNGSVEAYSNLGFCQELAGNPAAAEAAYQSGIARDPRSEPCRINYGLMLARHNHPSEALRQLQMVLSPAKAHYDLASVYQQQGRKLEARAEYQKALALDPQLKDARSKLASIPN